jgi:Domain of unknown function (DUF4349)
MRPIWINRHAGWVFAAMTLAVVGCDAESPSSQVAARNSNSALAPASPAVSADSYDMSRNPAEASVVTKSRSSESAEKEPEQSATQGRKIVYNARLDLVTEDLNAFETSLTKLIAAQKAYVADSDRTGSAGATRHGSWKVRVPVDGYDAFVKGAVALGELVSLKADSQDVSEEFFDLDARQKAKKVEEDRLLKHLTESTGKLDEILTVERELSRVRSEIERMQGRLRAIANLTSLATVTISANEIKGYVPPQAPTLGTRISRTFTSSLDSLLQFGETILIAFVAVVPWLPIIALGLGIVYWISRQASRRIPSGRMMDAVPPVREPG